MEEGSAWVHQQVQPAFEEVREMVLSELEALGDKVLVPCPQGAFYVFLKLKNEIENDMTLVQQLIEEYKVAVMPGSTFGVQGGTYLRIAYGALDKETVADGMGRLVCGLKTLL